MKLANVPAGKKLWGANLVLKPTSTGWEAFWAEWDWQGWIKPQIDLMVGNGIGANCIRLIGALEGVVNGSYTQAIYNARNRQLANYLATLGAYYYPCGGGYSTLGSITDAQIGTIVGSQLAALASAPNVIGCDVMQEQDGWSDGSRVSRTIAQYNAVKATGTALPLTFSCGATPWTGSTLQNWISSISAALDYLDFHIYGQSGYDHAVPISPADLNYWVSTYPGMDILCAEYGVPESETGDPNNTFMQTVLNVFNSGDARVRGALVWCGFDQDYNVPMLATNQWGLYHDASSPKRIRKTLPLTAMTGGFTARRN